MWIYTRIIKEKVLGANYVQYVLKYIREVCGDLLSLYKYSVDSVHFRDHAVSTFIPNSTFSLPVGTACSSPSEYLALKNE